MNLERFRDLVLELVDENPFAVRAALRILRVEPTTEVPTLAVTMEARPRLLVNLDFVTAHCQGDAEVKAVICHEFLHVLLRHVDGALPLTPARHLAFDAVVNALIHRELGPGASRMMSRYYAEAEGPMKLLRPPEEAERAALERSASPGGGVTGWERAWDYLYAGILVADDIEELAAQLGVPDRLFAVLLGDHDALGRPVSGPMAEALGEALRTMNGSGVWRYLRSRGMGANPYEALVTASGDRLDRWRRTALAVLRRHLVLDPRSRATEPRPFAYRVPVLSPGDRRAFLRSLWSPFLPEASWSGENLRPVGTAHVYLDLSGSMSPEMPQLVALLALLGRHIRRPFWAFSDEVSPALISRGQLRGKTSGGTRLGCVLEHVAEHRPPAAVIVTDGYIEELAPELLSRAAGTRLHALVTRDGNPSILHRAGLPYTQLERYPP